MAAFKPVTRSTIDHFRSRIQKIDPTLPPLWGKMSAAQMFGHVRAYTECALGIRTMTYRGNPLVRWFARRWFSSSVGFPKGMPSFRILFPDNLGDAEQERQLLFDRLVEFVAALEANPERMEMNEMMGELPLSEWAVYNGKHLDHHLRQFGV